MVALAAAIAGAAVGSGAGGEPARSAPPPVPIERLIGQTLLVRMEAATEGLVRRARRGQIGGVIVFPPAESVPTDVRRDVKELQRAARRGGNPPLLVATDQEGFPVNRFPLGPPSLPPPTLGANGTRDDAKLEGEATANYLRQGHLNVDLAPVLDVVGLPATFMSPRSYGSSPDTVARIGAAFVRGLDSQGVAATAKHFPGLGRATVNPDLAPSAVSTDRATLEEEMEPFRAAIRAGVPLVMVASASYEALDPGVPATLSENVIRGELRGGLRFTGAVITDDLEAEAIAAVDTPARAAVRAAQAGADLLLFARTGAPAAQATRNLERAVERGKLTRAELEASYARITALKDAYAG